MTALSWGVVNIVGFGGVAAIAAGQVRARAPLPPTAKRDRRPKRERHAAWFLDVQTAACAWAAGLGIATLNLRDFEHVADVLADVAPGEPRLEVVGAPY